MKKRGQVWYTDFVIGVLVFSIMVVAYFYYVEHQEASDQNLENYLLSEAKSISSYLVTEGYPEDWTASNVSTVGLTNGKQRIDDDKLAEFNSWTYDERKANLHTTKEYYFYLQHLNGTIYNRQCIDMPTCTDWNGSEYLVSHERLLIHDSKIVRMKLYIYQQP